MNKKSSVYTLIFTPIFLHRAVEVLSVIFEFDSWVFIIHLIFLTIYLVKTVLSNLLLW